MKASDIQVERNTSILFKSPFGHGKTIALASFALDGPIYLAYFDKKKPIELVTFFKRMGAKGQRILNNIEYDVYSSNNVNQYLNKLMQLSKDCRYFAVGTDSVTNLTSAAVNWSLGFRDNKKQTEITQEKMTPGFDEYKVETSLVTQALDICRSLPCHILWTAHPIPGIKIEGSGASIKVSKVNPIVTYGSKVAGIVPGNFSEIYHFSKVNEWDAKLGKQSTRYIVDTDSVGDDFAKSNIGLKGSFDITDQLFYEVWQNKVKAHMEEINAIVNESLNNPTPAQQVDPFYKSRMTPIVMQESTSPEQVKKWNTDKGVYE